MSRRFPHKLNRGLGGTNASFAHRSKSGSRSAPKSPEMRQQEQNVDAPKLDAVEAYMQTSNKFLQTALIEPLKAVYGDIRSARNYAVCDSGLQEQHGEFVTKMQKIDDEVWKVVENAKKFSGVSKLNSRRSRRGTV